MDVGLKDILAEDIFKEGKTPLRWAEIPGLSWAQDACLKGSQHVPMLAPDTTQLLEH